MKKKEINKNLEILKHIHKMKFFTDSFVCDKCGARMILKVYGDSTACRISGCNGTMHRVK